MKSNWLESVLALTVGITTTVVPFPPAQAQIRIERPPQFVLLAFDGSKSNRMWNETRAFASDLSQRIGKPVRFTYFINSAYYVPTESETRWSYFPPGKSPGSSAIGWGGDLDEVRERMWNTMLAHQEGHEIASHAVGHFDAGFEQWSKSDWQSEFDYFAKTMLGFLQLNQLSAFLVGGRDFFDDVAKWLGQSLKFAGFRAPQLGHSPGLWPVLEENGFRYDTSKAALPEKDGSYRWPVQNTNGGRFWDFPLAQIEFVGTVRTIRIKVKGRNHEFTIGKRPGSRIHSMDYNFYANQNLIHAVDGDPWHPLAVSNPQDRGRLDRKGNPIARIPKMLDSVPENVAKEFEKEMLDSYFKYFAEAYNGNRAPVHIGHHFTKWNHGAYWNVMRTFAETVCAMEEVVCVTYADLADFMDSAKKSPSVFNSLRSGMFLKGERTDIADEIRLPEIQRPVNAVFISRSGIVESVEGQDAKRLQFLRGTRISQVDSFESDRFILDETVPNKTRPDKNTADKNTTDKNTPNQFMADKVMNNFVVNENSIKNRDQSFAWSSPSGTEVIGLRVARGRSGLNQNFLVQEKFVQNQNQNQNQQDQNQKQHEKQSNPVINNLSLNSNYPLILIDSEAGEQRVCPPEAHEHHEH